jgi:hypothetical protein
MGYEQLSVGQGKTKVINAWSNVRNECSERAQAVGCGWYGTNREVEKVKPKGTM